ncbi:hypothetical protein PENSPDRAFT_677730 [Peniophora sp. CONT]|nr:hypothetical protein PENSPDRAFT_677730 [Peniophora sp. CONT]
MFNSSQYQPSSSQYSPYGHDSQYGRTSATPGPAQGGHGYGGASTAGHHPSGSTWGASSAGHGGMGNTLNDSFGQSRSTYQQGYILNAPSTSPRFEELPVVQTKAKMNSSLTRAPTVEFGKDPMFESSRRMQALDEDAPPTASVNDIVNATYADQHQTSSRNRTFENSFFASSSRPPIPTTTSNSSSDPLYVIVFGYPADKYSVTAEYFKQLGASGGAEPVPELLNAFKIGYNQPADALRAVRKNGEILAGQWMVGAKWENQAKAESVLGSSLFISTSPGALQGQGQGPQVDGMAVDEPPSSLVRASSGGPRTPVGGSAGGAYTPVRLAPAASAFRKPGTAPATPAAPKAAGPGATPAPTPGKGVLGQVSDMIFGW